MVLTTLRPPSISPLVQRVSHCSDHTFALSGEGNTKSSVFFFSLPGKTVALLVSIILSVITKYYYSRLQHLTLASCVYAELS